MSEVVVVHDEMEKQLEMYELQDVLRNILYKGGDNGYAILDINYPFKTRLGTIRIRSVFGGLGRYKAIGMVKDYLVDNGFISKDYWKCYMSDDCMIVSKETIDNLIIYLKLKGDMK